MRTFAQILTARIKSERAYFEGQLLESLCNTVFGEDLSEQVRDYLAGNDWTLYFQEPSGWVVLDENGLLIASQGGFAYATAGAEEVWDLLIQTVGSETDLGEFLTAVQGDFGHLDENGNLLVDEIDP